MKVAHKIEGKSLASLLTSKSQSIDRDGDPLLFHFPHYFYGPNAVPSTAIIAGNLKLIKFWESNSYKLFNLDEDLGEKNDLAETHPEKLKELVAVMNNRLRSVNAQLPIVNPDYDPNAPLPERPGSRWRGQGTRPGGGRPGGPRVAN